VDFSNHTGVTNNFLHSLFKQCNVTFNGVKMTQASENYRYSSYLETLMNYGPNAAANHLSNAYWYIDIGDMQPVDASAENVTAMSNKRFILRWNMIRASREVELFGRLHSDVCNLPLYVLPVVRVQIRFTKSRPS